MIYFIHNYYCFCCCFLLLFLLCLRVCYLLLPSDCWKCINPGFVMKLYITAHDVAFLFLLPPSDTSERGCHTLGAISTLDGFLLPALLQFRTPNRRFQPPIRALKRMTEPILWVAALCAACFVEKGLLEDFHHQAALWWQWQELMLWLPAYCAACSVEKGLLDDFHHQTTLPFVCLLLIYVIATPKVTSRRVLTCDSLHSWCLYSAAPLGNKAASTIT